MTEEWTYPEEGEAVRLTQEEMEENFKRHMLTVLSELIQIDDKFVPQLRQYIQDNSDWFEKVMGPGVTVVRDE